jgi:hypothetical protein
LRRLEKILDNFDILNKIYRYKLSKLLVKPKIDRS